MSVVGSVDWQGGGSDGLWSPKREPKRERDLILKFSERDLIFAMEKNEESFGYQLSGEGRLKFWVGNFRQVK